MPGGWTMSMMWMRMPGRTWLDAAASFIGMWFVMMTAMMLPSLTASLWRCRQAVASTSGAWNACLTTLVGVGYFSVWTVFGLAIYPLGLGLAAIEMKQPAVARAIPFAAAAIVLIAGAFQFTSFKTRHLGCCRAVPERSRPAPVDARTALRFGLYLGLHCIYCCAGFTAVSLVIGLMNLRAMALVTAAITVERLVPDAERVTHAIGAVLVELGFLLIAGAAGAS
jgi:predicted metal-binding membrane protein